jgi:hypothetical protein
VQEIPAKDLIKVSWALMVMQRPGKVTNPLLPNLLVQLYSFERPELPITNEEFIMLYQLDIYV